MMCNSPKKTGVLKLKHFATSHSYHEFQEDLQQQLHTFCFGGKPQQKTAIGSIFSAWPKLGGKRLGLVSPETDSRQPQRWMRMDPWNVCRKSSLL